MYLACESPFMTGFFVFMDFIARRLAPREKRDMDEYSLSAIDSLSFRVIIHVYTHLSGKYKYIL